MKNFQIHSLLSSNQILFKFINCQLQIVNRLPAVFCLLFAIFCHLWLLSFPVQGQEEPGLFEAPSFAADEALFWGEEEKIITATKFSKSIEEVPAVATVVTAEQMKNMGARDIMDVLRGVPGIGITKGFGGREAIEVRGIKTNNSDKVKLLIDSHSVNDNLSGGAAWSFNSLSVDNIKRIEIIRGPGSALYGSNAFSGMINVITKDGEDMDGIIASVGGGSFGTGKLNLQVGKKFTDLDVAFSADYFTTDGAKLRINSDLLGNSGNTDDFEEKLDLSLNMAYKGFALNSKYVLRKRGPYLGAANTLNDESEVNTAQFFVELSYNHSFNEDVKLIAKVYIDEFDWDAYWELFPEGTTLATGTFSDGMIGNPSIKERTLGTEFQLDYQGLDNNLLTFGVVGENRKQFDVKHIANFNPNTNAPLDSFQDISSWANFNQDKVRDIWAVYLQDVWDITENLGLTLGIRHDNYSDFGSTTNPRAALVWNFLKDWDAKFLYGTAFRAPSFEELFNINNPAVLGNPDLQAEKMRTFEFSVGYTYKNHTNFRISYFNNSFKNKIELVPQSTAGLFKFDNTEGAKVDGIEAEIKRKFTKDTYAYANYTYQNPEDKDTGEKLEDVPTHKGNAGINIGLIRYLNANVNLFVSGERPRTAGDTRSPMPAYALVDVSLIAKGFYNNLEIRGSVKNLFDEKYSDPATVSTVPGDFPREGTSFMLEALYKF